MITCLGEILFDFLPIEEGGETVGFRMYPGGSPLNIAVGTARLGIATAYACKLSTDFFGRRLLAYIERERIDARFVVPSTELTTLAIVAIEHNEPAFTFYGDGAADTLLQFEELPAALFDETRALHIGSISLLRGTTPDAALRAFEQLKGRALLSLDPNIRPSLVQHEAEYRARLDRALALADLVKISAMDLAWVFPGMDIEQAAHELIRRGPALVVVTRGGQGALALRTSAEGLERWEAPSFKVQVADTVGAGDSFHGGILAGLAERQALQREALLALPRADIAEVLRFAAATAAITVTRAGANPPNKAEVLAFLAQQSA